MIKILIKYKNVFIFILALTIPTSSFTALNYHFIFK